MKKPIHPALIQAAFAGMALLYLWAADFTLKNTVSSLPFLYIQGTHWNWSGKGVTVLLSLLLIGCSPWLRKNVGLCWRQAPGSWRSSFGICLGFFILGMVSGWVDPMPPAMNTPDTFLFQATMPSLEEELAFRGIALALLERAFGQSPMSCRWRFGWASLITSLLFWQSHGLARVDTFFIGAAFALVRTRSGSLLWPILCHSAVNLGDLLWADILAMTK